MTVSAADAWQVEPKPAPAELSTQYRAPEYRDPFLVPVLEKLSQADLKILSAVLGGWPIVPSDD